MSEEQPPKLDYADPRSPRSTVPPDGYLGYRSNEPPEGTQVGCVGWVIIAAVTLAIVYGLLWWLGLELKRHGA